MSCTPRNIPALTDTDCTNSNYTGTDATHHLHDLAGRPLQEQALGVATAGHLRTEAGVGRPAHQHPRLQHPEPARQPGQGGQLHHRHRLRLPANVDALRRASTACSHDWDGCGLTRPQPPRRPGHHHREVSGEEGFVDGSNGCPADGLYNAAGTSPASRAARGEFFVDLGEPFVDYNDNGIGDADEPYIDVNGNRALGRPERPLGRRHHHLGADPHPLHRLHRRRRSTAPNRPRLPLLRSRRCRRTPSPQPRPFSVLGQGHRPAGHPGHLADRARSTSPTPTSTCPTSRYHLRRLQVERGAKITVAFADRRQPGPPSTAWAWPSPPSTATRPTRPTRAPAARPLPGSLPPDQRRGRLQLRRLRRR